MATILALDAGTTSVRAIVFDHAGAIRALAQREITQIYPQPGRVEHDPREILRSQIAVAREALGQAAVRGGEVAAIGITNQRETAILWDRRTGEPLGNAIVWQDRRTAARCDELRSREGWINERTGLRLDPYFSATKIAWLLDHHPQARRRAEAGELAFGTVDSWLLWHLTGRRAHVTDVSNASRTMLFNLHTGAWDPEILSLFGIPEAILPEVRSSCEVYGEASLPGELAGVPVAGIAGDQQAALFGQMCVRPGMAKNTYGTGCFLLQQIGPEPVLSRHRLLTTAAWRIGGRTEYALEGSVFTGGAVLQWLRDGLGLIRTPQEADRMAESVPDSGGVMLVPAFTGLGAPQWDPYARGTIVGLTRDTTAAHLARAALEGIAFQVADLLDAVVADTGRPLPALRVDGGASRSEPLMQMQADLLQVPVVRPAVTETTALGAAFLAGLAVGYWGGVEAVADQWKIERTFEPHISSREAALRRERWNDALARSRGWERS